MAIKIDLDNIKNITEYPNSFKRQGAFPLERYSIFDTLEDAKDYAKNNSIAYVGQLLTVVVAENNVSMYKIVDANGTLVQIDGEVAIPDAPEYTIVKEVVDGKHQFYLAKEGDKVGESISFSDMVVTGGELVTFTDADKPEGLDAGTYLKLTIADQETPVYINVKELIDVYIGGSTDTITVSINSSEDGNKITAVVNKKSITGGADGHIALSTITAENISNNAIIERTIADGAVTTNKIANKAVTTAKIADKAVTIAKLADEVLNRQFTPIQHNHVLTEISDFSDYTVSTVELTNQLITQAEISALSATHEITANNTFIRGIKQENGVITSVITGAVVIPEVVHPSVDTISATNEVITAVWQTNGAIGAKTTQLSTSHINGFSTDVSTLIDTKISTLTATHELTANNTFIKGIKQVNGVITSVITGTVDIPEVVHPSYTDTPVESQVITAITQTNGAISVSRKQLSTTDIAGMNAYQVSGNYLSTAAAYQDVDYADDKTKLVNKKYVDETFEKIDNVMHFKGVVTVDPLTATTLTGYANGDVVIYGAHEYVFVKPESGTGTWEQFGDQSIDHSKYALSSEVSNHISAVEIVDNTNTVVETLSSTNHKIKLGTMAQAQTDNYYTKAEDDERFVKVQNLIIDCGGASDTDLPQTDTDLTPTDESLFDIDATGKLTAFKAESAADLGGTTVVVVPQTVGSTTVTSVGTVFKNNTWITAVYIPVGIDIPAGAFDGCDKLPTDAAGVRYTN